MSREVTACDKFQKSEENVPGKGARMKDICEEIYQSRQDAMLV